MLLIWNEAPLVRKRIARLKLRRVMRYPGEYASFVISQETQEVKCYKNMKKERGTCCTGTPSNWRARDNYFIWHSEKAFFFIRLFYYHDF